MKKHTFRSIAVLLLALASGWSHAQEFFELTPGQSMLMHGKGPGQDATVNPFEGQDCLVKLNNLGETALTVRIQFQGEVSTLQELPAGTGQLFLFPANHELYLDGTSAELAQVTVDYVPMEDGEVVERTKELDHPLKNYFEKMLRAPKDPAAPKLINYPTVAYAPETSWELGVSSLLVYSANRDLNNRLSEVKAFTFFTLENQYGIWLDHALYTDQNKWFFYGRARYQSFPLFYYGIGRETPAEFQSLILGNYTLLRERLLRETWPSLYTGLELDFQRLARVSYENTSTNFEPPAIGTNGSTNLGLGWGLLYNNIHNAMNPRDGLYSEWAFLGYRTSLGSDHNMTSYLVDQRLYRPVGKNNVLAAQLYGQFITGDAPFNMLSLMGGESLMRGYYHGRYRDKNLVAGQVEFRMLPLPFSKRWGASVFAAMGQVYGDEHGFEWNAFLPTGGAGIRYLIFPDKDIYTRIDLAYTAEGSGVYFYIGEAF